MLLPKVDDAAVVTMDSKDDIDNDEKNNQPEHIPHVTKYQFVFKRVAAVVVTGKFGAPLTLMAAARGSNLVRN